MDDFKKKLRSYQVLLALALLATCGILLLSRSFAKAETLPDFMRGFIEGFQVGIIIAILGALLYFIIKYALAIHNPDKLKKLYIAEMDERTLFIRQKSGSTGMFVIIFGLALGAATAGNFNSTVFFSLLGACLFVELIFVLLKLYYFRKY